MPNFSDAPNGVTLTGTSSFPTNPQVDMGFNPSSILIENLGSDDISFSFDGVNVHGTLPSGTYSERKGHGSSGQSRIWFRDEGGGGTAIARTTAYNF